MEKKSAQACELNTLSRRSLDNVIPKAYDGTSGRSFARSFMASSKEKSAKNADFYQKQYFLDK